MARSGLAKGANSGHITDVVERKAKPSHRKGVSLIHGIIGLDWTIDVSSFHYT